MPASEAQIRANQANAARSTGPRTEEGKARSRLNATTHGLASQLTEVEASRSPAFEERRAKWAAEQKPVGEAGQWALDRAVAASLRIERCELTMDRIGDEIQERARLAWDEDRAVEAARIFARLSKDPRLVSRKLQTTWAGAVLMVEAWLELVVALSRGDWSESEVSRALDLLGVPLDFRAGRTPVDAPEGAESVTFRRDLAMGEVARLEELRDESLAPLEDLEQRWAVAGASVLLSTPARLVLRYERNAWKHFNESMKELKDQGRTEAQAPTPAPVVVAPARPIEIERRSNPIPPSTSRPEVPDRPIVSPVADDLTGRGSDRPAEVPALNGRIQEKRTGDDGSGRRIEPNFPAGLDARVTVGSKPILQATA